ncbi:MAG: hypothetical protein Q7S40_30790 [Opitutaceae bacterium]|nr:hypothetical protein [Opitutaceae bacterium]
MPCGLSAHRWELGALLRTAHVAGVLPPLHIYSISIRRQARHAPRLSFATAAGVAVATCMVHGHAARLMSCSDAA